MKLEYDYDEQIIYIEKTDGTKEILEDNFPSEPIISPDETRAVYITPLEWETLGSLYLFDLLSGEKTLLIGPDESSNIPKGVKWIDNHTLAVIIGFGHGTIAIGGNVFTYNIETREVIRVTDYDSSIQITRINIDQGKKKAHLEGIRYVDKNLSEFEKFFQEVQL
ncbi:DUF4652 domain-containing protein [Priestia aryabhattai]|uniref:DUF4652 domain-containing protein n=1 Tax=Priestia aryabhattai TaxID=412384 RepID=UPI001CCE3F47|nr:DUF4652 domain-containing protein [Priestia aryabhattai]MBZ6485053.1 DUF4652 domain-containing protein [Priestia aryabhattai]